MSGYTIDKDDFESIFRENYTRLYYFALQFVGEDEAARDIVSEAFWAAWKNRKGIDGTRISSYLYVCVKNKSLTHLKRSQNSLPIETPAAILATEENEEKWKEREERYSEMEQEISKMSSRTRFVLQQCYLEGHTYKEVAAMLNITTDGVKKHITKALAQLRGHFNIEKHKR